MITPSSTFRLLHVSFPPTELESELPERTLSSFGEGGGLGRGVVICGGAFRDWLVTGSQVIWLYSSFLAARISSLAPLPNASSIPASFLTRLHNTENLFRQSHQQNACIQGLASDRVPGHLAVNLVLSCPDHGSLVYQMHPACQHPPITRLHSSMNVVSSWHADSTRIGKGHRASGHLAVRLVLGCPDIVTGALAKCIQHASILLD